MSDALARMLAHAGRRLEHHESRDLTRWLRARQNISFLHVPNEARRSRAEAARARAEGLSKGAPDFLIFTPPPLLARCPGVALEMKRVDGARKPSLHQRKWLAELSALGWQTRVCYGFDEAVAWLNTLGYV